MFGHHLKAATSRLSRTTLTAGLAAAAGLALIAAPIATADAAPTQCTDSSCILDLTVQPNGLSLGVALDTGVDTIADISVYKAGVLVGHGTDYLVGKAHTVHTSNTLTANTSYTWHAAVIDAQGNRVERTGEASTLHRRVTVQFQTVTVTNDSDTSSAGDFRTYVRMPGSAALALLAPEAINTGETKLLGTTLQQRDAGTTTKLGTEMYDNDTYYLGADPFPIHLGELSWDNGSGWWADWSTAWGTVNTTAATPGAIPFQISVNSYVGFIVRGTYFVDFVS